MSRMISHRAQRERILVMANRDSRKKHNNKQKSQEQNTAGKFFKGFGFSMGPHGPEMYQKTMHMVGLYASMEIKNGSNVTICLLEEKLVKPEVPTLEEEHTAHEKRVWEYRMNDLMKPKNCLKEICVIYSWS